MRVLGDVERGYRAEPEERKENIVVDLFRYEEVYGFQRKPEDNRDQLEDETEEQLQKPEEENLDANQTIQQNEKADGQEKTVP